MDISYASSSLIDEGDISPGEFASENASTHTSLVDVTDQGSLSRKPSLNSLPDHARLAEVRHKLQSKLPNRPTKETLQAQNILKANLVSPAVHAKHEALAKAKRAESLQERILQRPGPLDLVRSNVMQVPRPLKHLLQADQTTYNFRGVLRDTPDDALVDPNAPQPPPLPAVQISDDMTEASVTPTEGRSTSISRQLSRTNSMDEPKKPRYSSEIAPPTLQDSFNERDESDTMIDVEIRPSSPPLIAGNVPRGMVPMCASSTPPSIQIPRPPSLSRSFSEAKQIVSTPVLQPPHLTASYGLSGDQFHGDHSGLVDAATAAHSLSKAASVDESSFSYPEQALSRTSSEQGTVARTQRILAGIKLGRKDSISPTPSQRQWQSRYHAPPVAIPRRNSAISSPLHPSDPQYIANLKQQQIFLQLNTHYEQQQHVLHSMPTVAEHCEYDGAPSPRAITPSSSRASVRASPYRRGSTGPKMTPSPAAEVTLEFLHQQQMHYAATRHARSSSWGGAKATAELLAMEFQSNENIPQQMQDSSRITGLSGKGDIPNIIRRNVMHDILAERARAKTDHIEALRNRLEVHGRHIEEQKRMIQYQQQQLQQRQQHIAPMDFGFESPWEATTLQSGSVEDSVYLPHNDTRLMDNYAAQLRMLEHQQQEQQELERELLQAHLQQQERANLAFGRPRSHGAPSHNHNYHHGHPHSPESSQSFYGVDSPGQPPILSPAESHGTIYRQHSLDFTAESLSLNAHETQIPREAEPWEGISMQEFADGVLSMLEGATDLPLDFKLEPQ